MRYYSILDLIEFLKYQKIFNFRAVDVILTIFNSEKSEEEKLSEIYYILMECSMDGFIFMMDDKETNNEKIYMDSNQIILDDLEGDIHDLKKDLPLYKFQAQFINGKMLFICWIN